MQFLLSVSIFLISILIAFFIPGNVILRKISLTKTQRIANSFIIGIIFWAFQAYILGYLNIEWGTYLYLILFIFLQIYIIFKSNFNIKSVFKNLKKEKLEYKTYFLIILGIISTSSVLFTFGINVDSGFLLCCGDFRDNLLHLAYINQVIKNIPPMEPGLAGNEISNYHYWMHIVIGDLIRVFKLPIIDTTMRFFPIFLSTLLALLLVSFSQTLKFSKKLLFWLIFFFFFTGDFIYLVHLLLGNGLSFDNYIHTNITLFVNYPFGFSVIVIMGAINLLALYILNKSKFLLILTGLTVGSVIGFKVNSGFFMLSGLAVLATYGLVKKKFEFIILFLWSAIISLFIYLPTSLHSSGGLIFTGFWRVQDYIVQPSFGLSRMELARRIYLDHDNFIKVFLYNIFYSIFYLFAVLGVLLGVFIVPFKILKKIPAELNVFLLSSIVISFITGFFFIQNPGGANSMFFITISLVILSIYCALFADYWTSKWNKKSFNILISFLIVLVTIPTTIYFLYSSSKILINKPVITTEEMQAIKYLTDNTNKDSTLLVLNNYLDQHSSYINFLSDRPSFLSGQEAELEVHGIYFKDRQGSSDIIFKNKSSKSVMYEINKIGINYIYMNSSDKLNCQCEDKLKKVFQNDVIKILKTDN